MSILGVLLLAAQQLKEKRTLLVGRLDLMLPKSITTQAAIGAGLSLARSLWHTMPVPGEYSAANVVTVMRHHVEPQAKGRSCAVALGWHNVGYGTFAMMESILSGARLDKAERSRTLCLITA